MIQKKNHKKAASQLRVLAVAGLFLFGTFQQGRAQTTDVTLNSATTGTHNATHRIILDNGFSADASIGTFGAVIVPSSLFSCGTLGTPSSTQNYVATYAPRIPINDASTIGSHTTCEVNQTIQYIDGLGRPLQTVQVKANPDGTKDVVQPVAYDAFGRETTKYLPYTTASAISGNYRPNALGDGSGIYANSEQYGFYHPATTQNYTAINTPYAVTIIEPSPLNRVLEQGAPGDVWQPASSRSITAGRTVVMDYAVNVASEVLLWTVNSTSATASTSYTANTLYKTISKGENWVSGLTGTTEEFKDMQGHVVLKRVWESETSSLSTYYVYDDLDNLSYVIPPAVTVNTFTESDAVFTNLIYGYHYDERRRLIQKKIPGKGWEYMVYNTLDQVIATQDTKQQTNGQWIITKYDALGRAIISGVWNNSMSPADLKTNVYAQTINWEYKDNSQTYGYTLTNTYPAALDTVLNVNYYDDYNIVNLPSVYDQHTSNSAMTRGLATATLTNVLGTTDMLWAVNYYDDKGRATHTYAQHYLGGTANLNTANYDHIQNTYDFTNQVTNSTRTHYTNSSGTSSLAVTIANIYVYDHIGRKRQSFEQINGGSNTLISQNDYNEVGQELAKHLHSTDGGSTFLQDIAYSYNERGWLKTSSAPLFAMQLKYNDGAIAQYNGNIADQLWGTPGSLSSNYTYGYDALNRLRKGAANTGNDEKSITYDKMGNITAMERYLSSTKVDGLKYTYTGNQLLSVNDSASNDAGYKHGTFNYNYDVNGNMTGDGSKGTSGLTVSYNILNLPKVNTLSGSTVTYTYTAAGQKLRKVSTFGTGTTTDYISGIQYSGGTIDFIQTDEGRALNLTGGTVNYEYALADHLGNTRRTFDSSTGAGTAKQVDDYMPFGMDIAVTVPSSKNNYLYNKKELQEELGLYDYGARQYDPITGRWTSIDPKADLLEMSSQYAYALNSPIVYKDKDGELPIFIGGRVGKESERASKTYWDQELLNTIANSGIPNPGGTRIFVDGDEGAEKNGDWTGNYTISSEYALSRDARELAGRMRAKEDFNTILANLEKDPRSGKIIEKIQIYTHSRGGASGVGYTDELVELIKENANLFANPDHEIDFVFNMADHQSEGQTAPDGVDEYSVHHNRDKFSGNGMKGLKGAISTDEKSPGIVGAHANSSFVKDAKAFLKAWQRNKGDSKKLINDFVSAMQANGIKVTVNE